MAKFKTLRQINQKKLIQRTRAIMNQASEVNRKQNTPSSLTNVASSLTLSNKKIKWPYLSKVGQVMRYGYPIQD